MFKLTAEEKLRKSRNTIYTNRGGCIMAPVLSMGQSSIVQDIPTAATNGRDKFYSSAYFDSLEDIREVIGVDMHEGVHIFLRHMQRHPDLIKEDFALFNAAADYADNDFLYQIPGYGEWFVLPKGHLYDAKFHGWSVREIYDFLKNGRDKDKPEDNQGQGDGQGDEQGDGQGNDNGPPSDCTMPDGSTGREVGGKKYKTETLDEHDPNGYNNMSEAEQEQHEKEITRAIHEASVLCGTQDMGMPRQLAQAQEREADWREVTQQFFQNQTRGRDELTRSRFNRKRLVDGLYMAAPYGERLGRVIIAADASGSIDDKALASWLNHIAMVADQCEPDAVEVLWWDSNVVGHQTIEGGYKNLASVLKPVGGGGTNVSSVAKYIKDKKIDADCVIVLTDGWVESDIKWDIDMPTLWVVTERETFVPPSGQVVKFK